MRGARAFKSRKHGCRELSEQFAQTPWTLLECEEADSVSEDGWFPVRANPRKGNGRRKRVRPSVQPVPPLGGPLVLRQ